ncbi:MAG TPA: hypothetical protein DCM05_16210 [Elusimicrobia bacterium]|nr:hypothetical protein [Elusimicrobiota bacterium]
MDVVIIVLIPVLFLTLAASMLVVSQISGFFQFNKYSGRRQQDRMEIQRFMAQLASAQSEVFKRSQELEKLSANLQLNNQELARLNSMKSKFLSMVVHDMRTPLASIKGFGEMLSRQPLEGTQKKYVNYIVTGTDQINRLMADLTDLAVIEAGKLRMDKQSFDLQAMVNSDIVPSTGVVAQKKGVLFVAAEVPPGISVVGDRFRLGQALMNFLNNAVKFTPAGGKVELKVSVTPRAVLFQVKDTGPGIHASERKRVFEKFYQSQFVDPKDRKKGWGLGLSIAQEIVRSHQGQIGVDSAGLNKGSTFWYRIPLKPSRFPALTARAAAALLLTLLPLGLAGSVRAQALPIEEKAKFEKALEERANNVLLHILGPNRARVVVDATLDFTRTEKFDVKSGAELDKNSTFLWQNVGAQTSGPELLPGIPTQEPLPNVNMARSYERSNSYPAAFVKRLGVTVILDQALSMSVADQDQLQRLLEGVLEITPDRGDALTIVRAAFAPAWKTIWSTPESASLLFKYALISLMTLITLIVVAACFLKLAEAMDSMAQAQAHQLQMDFGQGAQAGKEGAEEGEGKKEEEEEKAEGAQPKIVFNVKPEQLETLLAIVRGQDPENIALIAAHLSPEVKRGFLHSLERSVYSEVIFHLGVVKFIDQEVVATIKDELERRLESAVGGRSNLLEMVEASDLRSKRELLKLLEERDPDLAQELRQKILLFEDLAELEEKDWSLVFSVVTLEEWAFALYDAPEELVEALKSQMLPKTWAILSQMMQVGRPSEGAIEQAHEKIVASVWKLVTDGRITNPITRRIEKMVLRPREGPPPMIEGAPELAG